MQSLSWNTLMNLLHYVWQAFVAVSQTNSATTRLIQQVNCKLIGLVKGQEVCPVSTVWAILPLKLTFCNHVQSNHSALNSEDFQILQFHRSTFPSKLYCIAQVCGRIWLIEQKHKWFKLSCASETGTSSFCRLQEWEAASTFVNSF